MNLIYLAVLLAPPTAVEKLSRTLSDRTFSGIHELAWFDYALLIPYFLLLGILGIYGAHRYIIIKR